MFDPDELSGGGAGETKDGIGRVPLLVALVISLVAVAAVILGARYVLGEAASRPVSLPEVPAPQADTNECEALLSDLPEKIDGHNRVELADPAPQGAAAWAKSSEERVTLRCGVELPDQYTELSATEEIGGVEWLAVSDADSELTTWFSVDRTPIAAVTTSSGEGIEDLAPAIADALEADEHEPAPAPLAEADVVEPERCDGLMDSLPETLADRALTEHPSGGPRAAWTAPGLEPVALACGVELPESYRPGERITQVDDVAWFEDPDDGTFYALGRDAIVALHAPDTEGNEAIVAASDLVAAHTEKAPGGEGEAQ